MKRTWVAVFFASLMFGQMLSYGRIEIPNGGERWIQGTNQWINWAIIGLPGDMPVQLILARTSGKLIGRIASGISLYRGNFAWVTGRLEDGTTAPAGSGYIIRMTRQSDNALIDVSDAPFTIVSPTDSTGTFRVVAPNGGEVVDAGSTLSVRWDGYGHPGVLMGVFVGSATVSSPLASGIPIERMRYDWAIPSLTAGKYRIKLVSSDEALTDMSDNDFMIVPATRPVVLSPDGGERYRRGETMLVRWRAENPIPGHNQQVIIQLGRYFSATARRPDLFTVVARSDTAIPISNGESRFRIPNDAPASNFYAIRLLLTSTLYHDRGIESYLHMDESNSLFIIE